MKSTEDWIDFFMEIVPTHITDTRWEHCLRVAKFAENLAQINFYSEPRKAFLAGITHDITKQKKKAFHLNLFSEDKLHQNLEIPEEAYHAFSAAIFLKREYHFHDSEILSAISTHTLGAPSMTSLERIMYASDFLGSEFAFKQEMLADWIEKTEKNLDYGIYLKASKTLNNLIETKSKIYQATIDTFNATLSKLT